MVLKDKVCICGFIPEQFHVTFSSITAVFGCSMFYSVYAHCLVLIKKKITIDIQKGCNSFFSICINVFDSDTVAERSALMEKVYPRLYLYCKQRGYDFRMVDLRGGVGTPVAEQNDTVKLHVENLQRCQKTQGPNLIVRYHPVVLFDRTRVQFFNKEYLCN